MAQKLMAFSEAYSAPTNVPSFSALWWLAMWLNVLMVSAPHAQHMRFKAMCLVGLSMHWKHDGNAALFDVTIKIVR